MTKFIEGMFDRYRPLFEKGGKLNYFWPLFEGQETFFLTPGERTKHGAHVRDRMDMKRLMFFVVYALVPCILFGWFNVGHQAFLAEGMADASIVDKLVRGGWHMFPIIATSYAAGGAAEILFCLVRKHEINEGFLVTGILYPLTLPPTIPLWMVAAGIIFGVVIGKEVFGGVGMNVLNPALTARAFVFFTYPAVISGAGVWDAAGKGLFANEVADGYTGATPLLAASSGALLDGSPSMDSLAILQSYGFTLQDMFLGIMPGTIGAESTFAALLGGFFLIVAGIASWRTMLGAVLGLVATAAVLNALGSDAVSMMSLPPHYHIVMGGFAFGTIFMATDPVSSAVTPLGRLLYGFGIGSLTVLIRVVNPAYPEGIMLAILFMNVFAPLLDHFVVRRTVSRRAARLAAA